MSEPVRRGESETGENAPRAGSPVSFAEWLGVAFALLFPTALTIVYFVAAKENPALQKGAFTLGKTIQFAFPVLFTAWVLRRPWRLRPFNRRGFAVGLLFGAAVFGAVALAGTFWADGPLREIVEGVRGNLTPRLESLGLLSRRGYLALALFYCVLHSGLEEYYWRWFAFGRLRTALRPAAAALIASIGFSLHHAVVLGDYFGYASDWTRLGTLAVFFGGFFWCRLYQKCDSIYAPWLSHALVDAAIFYFGYRVLFL